MVGKGAKAHANPPATPQKGAGMIARRAAASREKYGLAFGGLGPSLHGDEL